MLPGVNVAEGSSLLSTLPASCLGPAEVVARELFGCLLVKRQATGIRDGDRARRIWELR